ncbi:MAG TPA: transglutaminaseTgpA domain-containing protein [Candidatus Limnocylindrales bacterium]|nr:transglutaminaseTgpA domain-containing protein [Candidatus Limnocylindrales bacterium]
MTAPAASLERPSFGSALRTLPRGPSEGWLSLVATVVMVDAMALSLVNSGWTGNVGNSGFLPWLALGGVLLGAAGAKVGWGRWRTHVIGAAIGGLLIPLIVGGVLIAPEPSWGPAGLFERMAKSYTVINNVWTDLVVDGRPFTTEYGYYHLVFGAMIWGAGLLAGFAVFGHRRPLDVVITLGLILLANMALTGHDQLFLLEIYTAGALLLLIRTHIFEEELTWARRKIGDPSSISQLYLNGGAMFVTLAMIGAIALTAVASSAPLQGLFADLPSKLQSLQSILQKFAPPGGDFPGLGSVTFGDNAVTTGVWNPSKATAFRAELPRNEKELFKWRAGTYSVYSNYGWDWGPDDTIAHEQTPAGSTVLGGDVNGDAPATDGRREVKIRITPDSFAAKTILSPNMVSSVDRPTVAFARGPDGWFTSLESTDSSGQYTVTALVPDYTTTDAVITEPNLRLASTDYPKELYDVYTQLEPGAMGDNATRLLTFIKSQIHVPPYADKSNPYDLAKAIQDYLKNPANFTYDPDVRNLRNAQCGNGISTVECFAIIKHGYCDYYASTMAVLLRSSGVPARVAYGFLPGVRSKTDNSEVVAASLAHYWVEVYFPKYGWIEFDPTGGINTNVQPIPTGVAPTTTAKPSVAPSRSPGPARTPGATSRPVGTTTSGGAGIGPFIAIAAILVVGLALLLYAVARRAPRKPMHPDQAWGSLARLAARIGMGPRPSQTVYEYAGALGDAVPEARLELTTIARAKVEVAYGRAALGSDRMKRVAEAYQRLRFALFGVILRRGFRPRRPSRPRRR